MAKQKKPLFRSIFLKYISAFMLINFICLGLLSIIISSLISAYGTENQFKYLGDASVSMESFLAKDYDTVVSRYLDQNGAKNTNEGIVTNEKGFSDNRFYSFTEYLSTAENSIRPVIKLVSESVNNLFVFITD